MYIVSLGYFIALIILVYIYVKVVFNNNAELSKELLKIISAVFLMVLFIVMRVFAISTFEHKFILDAINVATVVVIYRSVELCYEYNNIKPNKNLSIIYIIISNFFLVLFATNRHHELAYGYRFSDLDGFLMATCIMKPLYWYFIAFVLLSSIVHHAVLLKKIDKKISYKTLGFLILSSVVGILIILGLLFFETVQLKYGLMPFILVFNVIVYYYLASKFELNTDINKFKYSIIEHVESPVLVLNSDGAILKYNEKSTEIFYSLEKSNKKNIYDLSEITVDDKEHFNIFERNFLNVVDEEGKELVFRVSSTLIETENSNEYYLMHLEDITNIKIIENDLYRLTTIDQLTGLYNRQQFRRIGETLVNETALNEGCTAVFLLDLDFFKKINDTYGHMVGDEFLIAISETMTKNYSKNCVIGRYGGEEFCGIINGKDREEIFTTLDNLRKEISKIKVRVSKVEYKTLSISVGYAVVDGETRDLDTLLRYADVALYRAKNNGRNKIEIY